MAQKTFGQPRRGATPIGGTDDGFQTGHHHGIRTPFVAEQMTPAARAGPATVGRLSERNRSRAGDENETATLECARGEQNRCVAGDFDALGQMQTLGPFTDYTLI